MANTAGLQASVLADKARGLPDLSAARDRWARGLQCLRTASLDDGQPPVCALVARSVPVASIQNRDNGWRVMTGAADRIDSHCPVPNGTLAAHVRAAGATRRWMDVPFVVGALRASWSGGLCGHRTARASGINQGARIVDMRAMWSEVQGRLRGDIAGDRAASTGSFCGKTWCPPWERAATATAA